MAGAGKPLPLSARRRSATMIRHRYPLLREGLPLSVPTHIAFRCNGFYNGTEEHNLSTWIQTWNVSVDHGGSMTINTRATEATTTAQPLDILALYRTMVMARAMNDMLKTRKTQGRFPFYIGCAGHESMAAVVAALDQDDWLSLYYRDLAAWLQRTGDIYGPLREAYSRTTGPMGAGRNMPSHYSSKHYRILPAFSEVGALAPFAGGAGFSLKQHNSKELVLFTCGDGGVATN